MQLQSTCLGPYGNVLQEVSLGVVTRLPRNVLWDTRSRQIPEVQIRAQIPVGSYTSISDKARADAPQYLTPPLEGKRKMRRLPSTNRS